METVELTMWITKRLHDILMEKCDNDRYKVTNMLTNCMAHGLIDLYPDLHDKLLALKAEMENEQNGNDQSHVSTDNLHVT